MAHDYTTGADVEKTSVEWRGIIDGAESARRIGGALCIFVRVNGALALRFEVYDSGALSVPRKQATQ